MSCRRLKWQTHGFLRMSGSSCSKTRMDKNSRTQENREVESERIIAEPPRSRRYMMMFISSQKLIFFGCRTWSRCRANLNDLLNTDHYAFKAHNDFIGLDAQRFQKETFFLSPFNLEFRLVAQWMRSNRLMLHPDKTKFMIFCLR